MWAFVVDNRLTLWSLRRHASASAGPATSCFHALASRAGRICGLMLSQTPALDAIHGWTYCIVPGAPRLPVGRQIFGWLFHEKMSLGWYRAALPRLTERTPFQTKACATQSSVQAVVLMKNFAPLDGRLMLASGFRCEERGRDLVFASQLHGTHAKKSHLRKSVQGLYGKY